MAASDNLNPELFHGTGVSIPVGGEIVPKNNLEDAGLTLNRPTSDANSTYFSTSNNRAWSHALPYRKNIGELYAYGIGTYDDDFDEKFQQRPRVYVTQPVGNVEVDPEFPKDSFKAPKQVVKDIEWTPPPQEWAREEWVQGTLPEINWNKYNAPNWLTGGRSKGYFTVKDDRGYVVQDEAGPVRAPSYYSHFPEKSSFITRNRGVSPEDRARRLDRLNTRRNLKNQLSLELD
jgi:hypothetical protein